MGNLTTSDMIIVITLVSIILVLVIVIIVLDILNKRNKKEDIEIDKIFDEEEKLETPKIELPSPNTPSRVEEIRYVEEDEEEERTKARLELQALKEELERQKEENTISPLAEAVEEEVLENIEPTPVVAKEEPSEPIKYNFDKMVESVVLDETKPEEVIVEEPKRREFKYQRDDFDNVEIQEAVTTPEVVEEEPVKEEVYNRFVEEPTIEMEPIYEVPEPQEFVPLPIENIDDATIEMEPINVDDQLDKTVEIQVAEDTTVEEPVVEEVQPVVEEKPIQIEEIATTITEDLKEVEQANLKRANEVQQDLNELLNDNIHQEITHHEDLEEENAIISVEALTQLSDQVYDDNENYQMSYEDEGNEPISIRELEKLYNTTDLREVTEIIKNEPEVVKEEVKTPEIDFKRLEDLPPISSEIKFKSSPFISPVFGVTESPSTMELEQTANLDKLNDEIKKTNEFLNKLRELQKNLD